MSVWLWSAASASDSPPAPADTGATQCAAQPVEAGVSFVLDEHSLLAPGDDHDYNGGGELTFSGAKAARHWFTLDAPLSAIDHLLLSPDKPHSRLCAPSYAIAGGLLVFTPQDIQVSYLVVGDRPYASLVFLSNGRRYVRADDSVAYNSSLTVGVLGLRAADNVQRGLHTLTRSHRPLGWSHQISAGGEPTARYTLARQQQLSQGSIGDWSRYDFKWTLGASAGTVTEGSIALAGRWGRISSPWWSDTAEQATYIPDTRPSPPLPGADARSEIYLLFGGRIKARAYNAFLQGQFRHSEYHLTYRDLDQVLTEGWAGVEWRSASGLEIRFLSRWQSHELRRAFNAYGSRNIIWGSVEIAKSWQPAH